MVGRFGGEEFVVLLPRADADEACRSPIGSGTGPASWACTPTAVALDVTISIGVAVLGAHGRDLFELLTAADSALYRAKDEGRDRVRLYAPGDAARPRQSPDGTPEPAALIPSARDPDARPTPPGQPGRPGDRPPPPRNHGDRPALAQNEAGTAARADRGDGADEAEDPAA